MAHDRRTRLEELDASIASIANEPPRGEISQAPSPVRTPIGRQVEKSVDSAWERIRRLEQEMQDLEAKGLKVVEVPTTEITFTQHADRVDEAFKDEAFLNLVESIREHGQEVPVKLRRSASGTGYEVVYGHRRVRACQRLGIPVRALLAGEMDDATLVIRMYLENQEREALSPYEQALTFRRWKDSGLFELQEIAHHIGRSRQWVYLVSTLLDIPRVILECLGDPRRIPLMAGSELATACRTPELLDHMVQAAELLKESDLDVPEKIRRLLASKPRPSQRSGVAKKILRDDKGLEFASVSEDKGRQVIRFRSKISPDLVDFIWSQIPDLVRRFEARGDELSPQLQEEAR